MTTQEFIKNQIAWLKELHDSEFRAVRDAVEKVEKTTETRFQSHNEFRSQLKDQAGTFVTRKELFGWLGFAILAAISIMQLFK